MARSRAEGIALEQTVEVPADVVPNGYVADEILGQIEELGPDGDGRWRVRISYSPDSTGTVLPQIMNVMFGNSSIQKGIKVIGFDPGRVGAAFPGARFGVSGVRRLANCPTGPMLAPVLKPMGQPSEKLAQIAWHCARAGAHIIKEDHGLADQPTAPFEKRVEQVAASVMRANEETGGSSLYFATLSGPAENLMARARFAKTAGAAGLLVMPGLYGFDLVRRLSADRQLNLPIMTHPSFLGPHVLSEDTGFSHGMMFGTLQRLAGADISVFPNAGGRFAFSTAECREIADACQSIDGIGRPILPSPGGGMGVERANEMRAAYGDDTVFLIGGSLLRHIDEIGDTVGDLLKRLNG
jgi:ribulose-bisphosphate carboxylase large chain